MSNRINVQQGSKKQRSYFLLTGPFLGQLLKCSKKSPAACSIRFVKVVYEISCLKTWNSPGVSNARANSAGFPWLSQRNSKTSVKNTLKTVSESEELSLSISACQTTVLIVFSYHSVFAMRQVIQIMPKIAIFFSLDLSAMLRVPLSDMSSLFL